MVLEVLYFICCLSHPSAENCSHAVEWNGRCDTHAGKRVYVRHRRLTDLLWIRDRLAVQWKNSLQLTPHRYHSEAAVPDNQFRTDQDLLDDFAAHHLLQD